VKRWLLTLLVALGLAPASAQQTPAPATYSEGQVWEYRNRPQDMGSLIRIQRVEPYGDAKVYHLTIIGIYFAKSGAPQTLGHIPVSQKTLDASVTRLVPQPPAFPPGVDEGIAEWRRAKGGVFTITLAEIANVIERTVSSTNP